MRPKCGHDFLNDRVAKIQSLIRLTHWLNHRCLKSAVVLEVKAPNMLQSLLCAEVVFIATFLRVKNGKLNIYLRSLGLGAWGGTRQWPEMWPITLCTEFSSTRKKRERLWRTCSVLPFFMSTEQSHLWMDFKVAELGSQSRIVLTVQYELAATTRHIYYLSNIK